MARQLIPLASITPNPDQPRKLFEKTAIAELAGSIRLHGLIQPITVRPVKSGYEIVAGERRWRAHCLIAKEDAAANPGKASRPMIACEVVEMSAATRDIQAIVENLHRADITALEESNAFATLIASGKYTEHTLAKAIGATPLKVANRLALAGLEPGIRGLVAGGQLDVWQAGFIAKLPHVEQVRTVQRINRGELKTVGAVRASVEAWLDRGAQGAMFADAAPPSKDDMASMTKLERKIEACVALSAAGFEDGELVAAQRVDPAKLATMADKLALVRRHLFAMEEAMRHAGAAALALAPLPLDEAAA